MRAIRLRPGGKRDGEPCAAFQRRKFKVQFSSEGLYNIIIVPGSSSSYIWYPGTCAVWFHQNDLSSEQEIAQHPHRRIRGRADRASQRSRLRSERSRPQCTIHCVWAGLRQDAYQKEARYLLLHAAMHAAPRMQLSGLFPTGRLSADGLPPPGVRQNSHPPQVPRHATAVEGHGGIPPLGSGAQQKKEQQDQAEAAARPAAHGFCIRCVEHGFEAVGSDEI